jgi:hypothetical protein
MKQAMTQTHAATALRMANAETQLYFSSNDVVRVLDEYLEALKAGNAPSREELLARYPELQVQLMLVSQGLRFCTPQIMVRSLATRRFPPRARSRARRHGRGV